MGSATPPPAGPRRRSTPWTTQLVVGALLSLSVVAAGAAIAIESDGAWWSAGVLVAEPALLVAAAVVVYALIARGWWLVAALLLLAVAGNTLLARVPRPGSSQVDSAPAWAPEAQRCATTLALPTTSFRLLQWTIEPGTSAEEVEAVVARSAADVAVLQGAVDPDLTRAVGELMGGESRLVGGAPPIAVFTRGVFHPCAGSEIFSAHMGDGRGFVVAFVGAREGASFPLVAAQMPAVTPSQEWERTARDIRDELGATVGALQASTLVVAMDAHAPWTWSRLNARFAAVGMRLVPTALDWPRTVGPLPWLPVHPFNRLWIGHAWAWGDSARVRVDSGSRAPIVTDVDPRVHTAGR